MANMVSQIRSTKSEEIRNPENPTLQAGFCCWMGSVGRFGFRHSDFFRISDFVLRASGLTLPNRQSSIS